MASPSRAIAADPEALQDDDLRGRRRRSPTGTVALRAPAPVPGDFADLSARLRPGVNALARRAADAERRARVGTPVLERTPPINRELGGVFGRARAARRASRRRRRRSCACATPSTRRRPLATTSPRARPSATTGTTGSPTCPSTSPSATSIGYTPAVIDHPAPGAVGADRTTAAARSEAPLAGYSGIQANGRRPAAPSADPAGRVRAARAADPARQRLRPGRSTTDGSADCQAGQTGYLARRATGSPARRRQPGVRDLQHPRQPRRRRFHGRGTAPADLRRRGDIAVTT